MQIQFTVKKKWPLENGKDSGGFQNIDGVSAYVDLPTYHNLEEGMVFEANAQKMVSKGSGKPYYKMLGPIHLPSGDNSAATAASYARHAAQSGQVAAPPRPAGNGYNDKNGGEIFVSAIMKSLIEAKGQQVDTQDLALFAQAAVQTYNEHVKGKV